MTDSGNYMTYLWLFPLTSQIVLPLFIALTWGVVKLPLALLGARDKKEEIALKEHISRVV